jgi:hypothetical protein
VPGLLGQSEGFYMQEDPARALTAYRKVLSLVPDHLGARIAIERLAALSRRILLVLGMHRSGTSALAGFLCQHGFQGPAQSPPADLNNPTGYWEPQTIVDLHTALLEEVHSSWEDPLLSLDLSTSPQLEDQLSRLQGAIQAEFPHRHSDGGIPLIKDPRQCRLQPLWNLLLKRPGITCALVLMNRHPSAVVQSLQRRDRLARVRIRGVCRIADCRRHGAS